MGHVISKKVTGVLYIQICNESKLNALDGQMMSELDYIVEKANLDLDIKVVVIKGTEKAFSVGLDVKEFEDLSEEKIFSVLDKKWQCISNLRMPVIAAVSGFTLGGGFELALMCDMIIADNTAKFGFPEINLGLMPGNGGYQRLSKIVGKSIASYLVFSGELINASKAFDLHIISHLIQSNEMDNFIKKLVLNLSKKSRHSLESIKHCIISSEGKDLKPNLELEISEFRHLLLSKNAKMEVEKFLNRHNHVP